MADFSEFLKMVSEASEEELRQLGSILTERLGLLPAETTPQTKDGLAIISGSSHEGLAQEIASYLGLSLLKRSLGRFYNDELQVQLDERVRRRDVCIVQSVASTWHNRYTVNDNLVELLLMIDAARRAAASSITAVITHYGYGKQDQKFLGRQPISAKLVANLIQWAGANRVIAIDLHAGGIQGFFDIPVDNLYMIHMMLAALEDHMNIDTFNKRNYRVVSPDVGGVSRSRWVAEFLKLLLSFSFKKRPRPDVAEVTAMVGDVGGKTILVPDDLISFGGTMIELHDYAVSHEGIKSMIPLITHPSPKKDAMERILRCSNIPILVVSDTIPITQSILVPKGKKLIVVSPASMIASAIARNQLVGGSVSELFGMDPKTIGLRYKVISNQGIREFSVPE